MTIATYANLIAKFTDATTNWMARAFTTDEADEFLDLAEAMFNMRLRCREMETVDDLTPSSSVCTLPTDYLEYKRVVELASIRRPLSYITEDAADQLYPTRESGLACHFMIVGSSLTALPLSANDIELTYYAAVPALSGSATTNWLLTKLPNLYLHGMMMMAAEYTRNQTLLATETAFVERYIAMLHELDNRAKFASAEMTIPGAVW